jgi:uncharacterized membrane protein YoaK (UPF0700 family)
MLRLSPQTRRLAASLSALAGFVDAVGFLNLGGFFVSFMSGNSTRLAAGIAEGSSWTWLALALIAAFVSGVAGGTRVARSAKKRSRSAVLILVAILLVAACLTAGAGFATASVLLAAVAMGAENAVFMRDGGLPVGLTYMTGTLVRLGQELGGMGSGNERGAWKAYAWHWLALVGGAIAGALFHRLGGLSALWIAALAATILAWIERRE